MADLFKQERFSDAELVIRVSQKNAEVAYIDTDERDSAAAASEAPTELLKFPAHRMALIRSDFFNAQVGFQEAQGTAAAAARPQLEVKVADAAHVPVMERIINCMYLDSSKQASAFSGLSQQQLVLAVKYGDMLQFQPAVEHAAKLLQAAVVSDGLNGLALDALCELGSLPDVLIPALPELMNAASGSSKANQLLLSVMADLELVWEQPQLKDALLRLPRGSLETLLSSDQLSVSSEDTVLYTVGEYVCSLPVSKRAAAANTLSNLIRCQHLSSFQLMAQAVNTDTTHFNVLKQFQSSLRLLMTTRRVPIPLLQTEVSRTLVDVIQKGSARARPTQPNDAVDAAFRGIDEASRIVAAAGLPPNAPESWSLPARNCSRVVDRVEMVWQVDVADIKAKYSRCAHNLHAGERCTAMYSAFASPPLNGVSWKFSMDFLKRKGGGVELGVYLKLYRRPRGVALRYHLLMHASDTKHERDIVVLGTRGRDWVDFFGMGLMQGDFEKSVWVTKKNLPCLV